MERKQPIMCCFDKGGSIKMLRALPYIMVGGLVYLMLSYMANYQPELLTDILLQIDIYGITPEARQEQARLAAIKELTIPFEEKEVLVNRTVFLGATQEMVLLALGEPKKVVEKHWEAKNLILTYYIYYLPNEKRPTIFVFQEGKLINAYKDSAINVVNY